jgi:hypothetical protein
MNKPIKDFKTIIESEYPNQTINDYYYIFDIDLININYSLSNYHYIFKVLEGLTEDDWSNPLIDHINNKSKKYIKEGLSSLISESLISLNPYNDEKAFRGSGMLVHNMIWGKKASISHNFIYSTGKLQYIFTGINFNQYFTNINTNTNLQDITTGIQSLITQSNLIYGLYKNVDFDNKPQMSLFLEKLNKNYNKNKIWICDTATDLKDTKLYLKEDGSLPLSLDNLRETDTLKEIIFSGGNRGKKLKLEEILIYKEKIINTRQQITKYNGDLLDEGDSNIIHYRTSDEYYILNWTYIKNVAVKNKNDEVLYRDLFLCIEFNVDDYLNKSIQIIRRFANWRKFNINESKRLF